MPKSGPQPIPPVDPKALEAAAPGINIVQFPSQHPAIDELNRIVGPRSAPQTAPIHLIVELRNSEPFLKDPEKPARATPTGRRGERRRTRAAYLAIVRYVEDFGIGDCPSARKLACWANGYALHLGLRDADLLDPEDSTFREIAGDVLKALRVPAKPGWTPD
jgi:hypothetical protein